MFILSVAGVISFARVTLSLEYNLFAYSDVYDSVTKLKYSLLPLFEGSLLTTNHGRLYSQHKIAR